MTKFDIDSLKPVKLKNKKSLFKNHADVFLRDNNKVSLALAEAIMEGDKEAFHDIIAGVLSVINKEELARRSKVPIATIRRMAQGSNFNVDNMLKITAVIGKDLAA